MSRPNILYLHSHDTGREVNGPDGLSAGEPTLTVNGSDPNGFRNL